MSFYNFRFQKQIRIISCSIYIGCFEYFQTNCNIFWLPNDDCSIINHAGFHWDLIGTSLYPSISSALACRNSFVSGWSFTFNFHTSTIEQSNAPGIQSCRHTLHVTVQRPEDSMSSCAQAWLSPHFLDYDKVLSRTPFITNFRSILQPLPFSHSDYCRLLICLYLMYPV